MKPAGVNQQTLGRAKTFQRGRAFVRGLIIAQASFEGKRGGAKSKFSSATVDCS
jgi:hypothetical protein